MRRTVRFSLRTSVSCVLPLTGSSLSVTQKMRLLALGDLQKRTQRMSAGYISALESFAGTYSSRKAVFALAKTLPMTVSSVQGLNSFWRYSGSSSAPVVGGVDQSGIRATRSHTGERGATHAAGGCACL